MKVRLADGTYIQARGGEAGVIPFNDHETPNWALYLDEQWQQRGVSWPNVVISWSDFGLPTDESELFRSILRAWDRAKSGETVEIACDGGTGRTGTVVACLAVLSGISEDKAVAWTRQNYDQRAVEVPEQEGLIARFATWIEDGNESEHHTFSRKELQALKTPAVHIRARPGRGQTHSWWVG